MRPHQGWDLAAAIGTEVYAINEPWDRHGGHDPATNSGGIDVSELFPGQQAFPFFASGIATVAQVAANFGASAFAHDVPFGFVAWDVVE